MERIITKSKSKAFALRCAVIFLMFLMDLPPALEGFVFFVFNAACFLCDYKSKKQVRSEYFWDGIEVDSIILVVLLLLLIPFEYNQILPLLIVQSITVIAHAILLMRIKRDNTKKNTTSNGS